VRARGPGRDESGAFDARGRPQVSGCIEALAALEAHPSAGLSGRRPGPRQSGRNRGFPKARSPRPGTSRLGLTGLPGSRSSRRVRARAAGSGTRGRRESARPGCDLHGMPDAAPRAVGARRPGGDRQRAQPHRSAGTDSRAAAFLHLRVGVVAHPRQRFVARIRDSARPQNTRPSVRPPGRPDPPLPQGRPERKNATWRRGRAMPRRTADLPAGRNRAPPGLPRILAPVGKGKIGVRKPVICRTAGTGKAPVEETEGSEGGGREASRIGRAVTAAVVTGAKEGLAAGPPSTASRLPCPRTPLRSHRCGPLRLDAPVNDLSASRRFSRRSTRSAPG